MIRLPEPEPDRLPYERPTCRAESNAPIADIALGALSIAASVGLALVAADDCSGDECDSADDLGFGPSVGFAAAAFVAGASAYEGFLNRSACRERRAVYERNFERCGGLIAQWRLAPYGRAKHELEKQVRACIDGGGDAVPYVDTRVPWWVSGKPRPVVVRDEPEPEPETEGEGEGEGEGEAEGEGQGEDESRASALLTDDTCAAAEGEGERAAWSVELDGEDSIIAVLVAKLEAIGCAVESSDESSVVAKCDELSFEAKQEGAKITLGVGASEADCLALMERVLTSDAGEGDGAGAGDGEGAGDGDGDGEGDGDGDGGAEAKPDADAGAESGAGDE